MPKLPRVTGAQLVRALQKAGFAVTRQRGSHVQLRREDPDGTVRTFPVPVHAGRTVKKGTLRGVLRLADLDVDRLRELL
jgi:predicted RNA binding protein YcfA (HicA-like mRNA interferase family)